MLPSILPILPSYHLTILPSYHLTTLPPYHLTTLLSLTLQVFYAITFSKELNSIGGDLYAGAPTLTQTRTLTQTLTLTLTLTRTRTPTPTLTLTLSPARASTPGALFGALVELPAYVALAPATNRLGRRAAYAGFMLLAAAACIVLQLELGTARHGSSAPAAAGANATRAAAAAAAGLGGALGGAARWRATGAVLCGRFASVAAVNVGYIVSAELFPTSCRNSGIGWSTGCGRIGAMLAPHLMLGLAKPLLLFALLCVAAAATMGLLPESAGAAMADVPEAERVGTGAHLPASPGLTPIASPREVPLVSASAGGATDTAGGRVQAPAGQRWRDGV